MKVITVINQKGGVGKTTLSIHAAAAFARRGARTLLIDADPQASAMDWSSMNPNSPSMTVISVPKPQVHRDIKTLGAGYDYVFVDGPPRSTDLARSAVAAADLVLIPIQPSPLDVWATKDIVRIVEEAQTFRATLQARFVLNRRIANTAIGRDVYDTLASQTFPTFATVVTQRVGFAEALVSGETVYDTEPRGPAVAEIEALCNEIEEALR